MGISLQSTYLKTHVVLWIYLHQFLSDLLRTDVENGRNVRFSVVKGHLLLPICLTYTLKPLLRHKARRCKHKFLLHFELGYFTGVKRLTPPKKYISHFKNEVKAITHLVTKKFAWKYPIRCFAPRRIYFTLTYWSPSKLLKITNRCKVISQMQHNMCW